MAVPYVMNYYYKKLTGNFQSANSGVSVEAAVQHNGHCTVVGGRDEI